MLQLINILGHGGGRQEKVENEPAGGIRIRFCSWRRKGYCKIAKRALKIPFQGSFRNLFKIRVILHF